MITKSQTLKLIKEKVDSRKGGKIKLAKKVNATIQIGVFKHSENVTIENLFKQGNSVMFTDSTSRVFNINILDAIPLRQMAWQVISESEKRIIAFEHLYASQNYLINF